MNIILLHISSFLLIFWGISHLLPTRNVIKGFGDLTTDHRNIIAMEWINEGAILIFLGMIVLLIALADPAQAISGLLFICIFGFLNTLSPISLFTGFRVNFLPFKLCPIIFTRASLLILLGGIICSHAFHSSCELPHACFQYPGHRHSDEGIGPFLK